MKTFLLILLAAAVYALHQDYLNFAKTDTIGFLPIGLWYQALYACLCAVTMWIFGTFAWPKHLEQVEAEVLKQPHSGEGH